MWGIIPAAGQGSRMQPLAFSKELLPVGSRAEGDRERPRAVSEYLVERLVLGGATRICFVISPGKSDILEYYGGSVFSADVFYAVQPRPAGLCDAVFRAAPLIGSGDDVLVDDDGTVVEIQVKDPHPRSTWVWGAFKLTGEAFHALHDLWREPGRG